MGKIFYNLSISQNSKKIYDINLLKFNSIFQQVAVALYLLQYFIYCLLYYLTIKVKVRD